jgi:hypothetical protein
MRTASFAFAAGLAALVACQAPDVGEDCTLNITVPQPVKADYLETGATGCDNPFCIRSELSSKNSTKKEAYCSKACVADGDCSPNETGLQCRKVVLDDAFLATLDEATKKTYLGDTAQISTYCAAPLPAQ